MPVSRPVAQNKSVAPSKRISPYPFHEDTTMPFTPAQLAAGANATIETFRRNSPTDQINQDRPLLKALIAAKKESTFGNGYFNETVYVSNDSNYQNYFGADQVTFNERNPTRLAKYTYANAHDGFWFDEDRQAANGIGITDDGSATVTAEEKQQLVNLVETFYMALKESFMDGMALEILQDGSANPKAMVGLDAIVDTTPAVGVVGGLDGATALYWRNYASMAVSSANLLDQMEIQWRNCSLKGGKAPTKIVCGATFLDAYRAACSPASGVNPVIARQVVTDGKGGVALDGSVSGLFFKGIPLEWDPTFETLDAVLGVITHPWTKRCYFLNMNHIKLRPVKGAWMQKRPPQTLPDRYVWYFGLTSKQALTTDKRNVHAVLSIA